MTSIENNNWKEKEKKPFLSPKVTEEPIYGKEDRYKGFDDLRPREDTGSAKLSLVGCFTLLFLLIFLFLFFKYWL